MKLKLKHTIWSKWCESRTFGSLLLNLKSLETELIVFKGVTGVLFACTVSVK